MHIYAKKAVFLSIILLTITILIHNLLLHNMPATAQRTVIDNERGFIYVEPYDGDWSKIGAYIGLAHYDTFAAMNSQAIKGIHGRFQHFHTEDEQGGYAYFPYTEFRKYEQYEWQRRRPPLWITATYKGKKRPIIFKWFWEEDKIKAQAVNIGDERYIKFFIKNYVRQQLQKNNYHNLWVGLDSCAFDYQLYGVLDDKGNYVENVTWDKPFPQNNQEFLQAVKHFFKAIKQSAPDIKIICNEGSLADESQYNEVFANTDGAIIERFLGELYDSDNDYTRTKIYRLYLRMKNFAANKVQIYQPNTHSQDVLIRNMYLGYLIFGGKNRFFSARDDKSVEINPSRYAEMKNALGEPVQAPQDKQELNKGEGYRLYSRRCQGGIAYLNLMGKVKTIDLSGNQKFFDAKGKPVKQIKIADKEGKYVLFTPGSRTEKPAINPRTNNRITGSVSVTMSSTTPNTTIRYTLDGSEPNSSSPKYTNPITLSQSAIVKSKAFRGGFLDSFVSTAAYNITSKLPTVEFHLSADSGSEFFRKDYPLVVLSNPSAKPVTVDYFVTGGTANKGNKRGVSGKLTFQPGEKYNYFPLEVINNNLGETTNAIKVTLSHSKNAYLGSNNLYIYTIKN
jgi:hypothetical protein